MRKTMTMLALTVATVTTAAAQANERNVMELTRAELETAKKGIVAANMNLTNEEADRFWPLFDQYQAEWRQLGMQRLQLIQRYADSYQAMTDATADALAADLLAQEKKRTDVRSSWYGKMKQAIPAAKAARWLQIENKIQAIVDYELAAAIPLVPAGAP